MTAPIAATARAASSTEAQNPYAVPAARRSVRL